MGSLIADVVLLTIMLIGLLPPRFGGGDAIGLDRVLWKQVRYLPFSLWYSKFTDVSFVRKGIVWLLAAIIVEIPPTVHLYILLSPSFSLISISSQVFICLDLNGSFLSP